MSAGASPPQQHEAGQAQVEPAPAPAPAGRVFFSTFDVTEQVFLRTEHVVGIVNLKPIVPCHVLLIPPSPSIARLSALPGPSLAPFLRAVQLVSSTLERLTGSTSSNIAIQDGPQAGQTVPHLHVHVLPRREGDFAVSDEIYAHLEIFGFDLPTLQAKARANAHAGAGAGATPADSTTDPTRTPAQLAVDADAERVPRSREEMAAEAAWLRGVFDKVDFSV